MPLICVMELIYRKLKSSEAKDFRRVRLDCLKRFPDKFGSSYEDELKMPRVLFEDFIENESENHVFFGAFADNNLIGIAGFVRGNRRKTRHRGEIVSMYVNPDFQGQKIGEKLLRALIEEIFNSDEIESLELTVVADNISAAKLYERVGFETFGIRKNYFKSGEQYWDQRFMLLMRENLNR